MALVTYDDLTATIAAYLNRSDMTAVIPDWIRLAEARFQRDVRPFLTRITDYALPLSSTTGKTAAIAGSSATPYDIDYVGLAVVDVVAVTSSKPLTQVTEQQLMHWLTDHPEIGEPECYAVTGQQLTTYPFPNVPTDSTGADSSYVLRVSMVGMNLSFALPISASNYASNPVFGEHPDLYLYGALAESAVYLRDDERLGLWESRYADIVKNINKQDDRLAYGGRPFTRTLPVVF